MINPVYAARRIAYKLYERRHRDEPWLAQGAIAFIDLQLSSDDHGLEWGSGRSTQWFAARLAHLTSIESDAAWYETVREQTARLTNVDLRHIALDHAPEEPTRPVYDPQPKYVAVTDQLSDASLNFVLVDGHYRQACVLAALPKITPGGLLAIDNSNWLALSEWNVPADWPLVHQSSNVMTETSVWRKPGIAI